MRLEEHFGSSSTVQRNERVKLAASFWNNVGAGMVVGGMAGAFFLDKPSNTLTKIGVAVAECLAGFVIRLPANQNQRMFSGSPRAW
jgi:hypothetical protein